MLAKVHITPSATSMLASCDVARAVLALEALNSVSSPTAISVSKKANSTPSMWRVKRYSRRLIAGTIVRVLGALLRLGQFAEQVVIDHLARDRGGVARAEPGILDDHRERDRRLVSRGIGDEQGMVAMALVHPALHVFLALLDADDLRGAGLAGADVRSAGESARTGAFPVDTDQRLLDDRDVLGLHVERAQRLRLDRRALLGADVLYVVHDVRPEHHTVVGKRGNRAGELQRRVGVVALADADADGLASKPFLLEAPQLPFLRRQDTGGLAGNVDLGAAAEAEDPHEARDRVDAE